MPFFSCMDYRRSQQGSFPWLASGARSLFGASTCPVPVVQDGGDDRLPEPLPAHAVQPGGPDGRLRLGAGNRPALLAGGPQGLPQHRHPGVPRGNFGAWGCVEHRHTQGIEAKQWGNKASLTCLGCFGLQINRATLSLFCK